MARCATRPRAQHERERSAGEEGEAQPGEVAVAVVGELEAGVNDATHRQHHQRGICPRGEARRPAPAQGDQYRRDEHADDERHEKARRPRIDPGRQLVHRGQPHRPQPLPRIEHEAVGGHGESRADAIVAIARHGRALAHRPQGHGHSEAGQSEVGKLLDGQPSPSQAEPAERIRVEEEERERQHHARCLERRPAPKAPSERA